MAVLVLLLRPPGGPAVPTNPPNVGSTLSPSLPALGSIAPSSAAVATQHVPATPGATTEPQATPGSEPTPKPTPPPPTVVLVGAGDIADCNSNLDTQTAALVDGIAGTVFTLGDNAYEDGTRAEFDNCYHPTWGRFKDRTRPAPGNHEYHSPGAAGYFSYFGDRAGPAGRGYYAYTRGAWRIYSLNSECGEIGGCGAGSAQLRWLRNDIAAHPNQCSLAYWHHPRYSSGEHGSQAFMDPIWDALYGAGAELVLAGHDHSYERFAPVDNSGNREPGRGIVSFVVGTGGREFYQFDDILPTSRAHAANVAGVLRLTLTPDGWTSRFIALPGDTYTDEAQGSCH